MYVSPLRPPALLFFVRAWAWLGRAATSRTRGGVRREYIGENANGRRNDRTKKYLKKQQLRDWIRVVSTSVGNYELRFYNVVNDEADEDED